MKWDAGLSHELAERVWRDPNSLFAIGQRLQDKPRCSVTRLDESGGSFVWKRHNWGGIGRTLRKTFSKSVAKKCWTDGRYLCAAGVPTPRPRLYLEQNLGPTNTCSYLLTDYVEGTSLYRYMRFHEPAQAMINQLARQVAAIWQQLDDLRIQHNDFQTENFLVDPQGKLWLIDLERLRRCRRTEEVRRRQIRDIEDLLHPRNWRSKPEAAETFRCEILKTPAAIAVSKDESHPLKRPVLANQDRPQTITVLVPCLNAADTISMCLQSVRDMADEILVADGGSTDETLSIARSFKGCRVVQQLSNDAEAFEAWALEQARHPWILRVLPNERVNAELAREAQYLTASTSACDAYFISRAQYFRGRPLNHGHQQDDASIRLFRKDAVRLKLCGSEVEVVPNSSHVGKTRFPLVYESCTDLRVYVDEMMLGATEAATIALSNGERPNHWNVLVWAPWKFFKSFILQRGWLDGWAGLHVSVLSAFALYLRETMLWELRQQGQDLREHARAHRLKVFAEPVEQSDKPFTPSSTLADELPDETAGQQVRSAA
jgi:(heptosyl)LPS beta-1,4-glucosyltransferase